LFRNILAALHTVKFALDIDVHRNFRTTTATTTTTTTATNATNATGSTGVVADTNAIAIVANVAISDANGGGVNNNNPKTE
jgi:hypothetical protein